MSAEMGEYWDERARENAHFFIYNRLDYNEPDIERFWASGANAVDRVLLNTGVAIGPDDDVIEIGCGMGRLTRVLSERARSVRALDVSAEMLTRAQELNPQLDNVTWVHGDGSNLTGIADSSADGCFSHVVFQHLPDPEITYGYVREMGRVLRPGGWAAFQVSNDPSIHRPWTTWKARRVRVMSLLRRAPGGQRHPAWLGSAIDLDRLRDEAEAAGMSVSRVTGEGDQLCFVGLTAS